MENYFILLELPFDPPVNDTAVINEAIKQKQAQWSRDLQVITKKARAGECLKNIENIKKVMLDPDLRKKEAQEAKKIKAAKKTELDNQTKIDIGRGDTLSEKRLEVLYRTFSPYGFTKADIKASFESHKGKSVDMGNVMDKVKVSTVQNALANAGMKGKTLYDFLGLPQTASCDQLKAAAAAKNKIILTKGEKTPEDNAAQSLCGIAINTVFCNPTAKNQYDNYIRISCYHTVNEAADEFARGNSKRIEPKMKETLIDIAVRDFGISVSEASTYINNYCAYMGYALPENKIICGLCGEENPPGTMNCLKCKKPLILVCPSCGAQNSNAVKKCSCGFDFSRMDEAIELLGKAKQKYAAKQLDEAEKLVKAAKAIWANHPEIVSLEKTIVEEKSKAAKAVAEILADVNKKNFYSARTGIEKARANGYFVDDSIVNDVNNKIKDIESRIAATRTMPSEKAFAELMALSSVIADSQELKNSLQKYPPEAPASVSISKNAGDATVSWKSSTSVGDVSYRLVRKENSYPNGPDDGEALYNGKETSFTDRGTQKNKVYYYSVFSCRLGVFSQATRLASEIVFVEPVKNLKAIGGDKMVALSWNIADRIAEVRVWKYSGSQRPMSESGFEAVECHRFDGITLTELENGTCYWFIVSIGYNINGKIYFSEKEMISAVPQKPAKPLENFKVSFSDDIFKASWEKSEWDVILFNAKRKPDYGVGIIYDLDELLIKYDKIDINLLSLTEAEFRMNFIGECYIIPGVINASNVILNEAAYISSVPPVKDISSDVNAAGTEMYINFTWPRKIERSLLVYRMDSYPEGIDDPLAHRIECSKKQYEANEGIVINNPSEGTFYAVVYSYFENDGRKVYSEPCRALLSNEPQKDVQYSFEYKKAGLFSKKYKLTIEIETNGGCVFPGFVVVSKFKSVPLKRSDGDVVCTVNENTEIKGSYKFEFDAPQLREGTRLKLFFLNDKHYRSFRIVCKEGNTI